MSDHDPHEAHDRATHRPEPERLLERSASKGADHDGKTVRGTGPSELEIAAEHRAHEHGEHAAHDKHAGHSVEMFRSKFWSSFVLTIPILAFGHMVPDALGIGRLHFPGSEYVPPVLGTALFAYSGWVFLRGAIGEIRARLPGMMTLISLAITVAFAFSVAVELGFPGMPLWEELATLITIMILGHWLEMRSIGQASGALQALAKLLPATATRVIEDAGGERTEEVRVEHLREGDRLLVRPGERIPADGVVRVGTSAVNESLLTGESRPVEKVPGAQLIAGAVNGSGSLRIEVTATGERTALSGIMRLVEQAQTSKSRAQALADRAARWLTWIALAAGAVTLVAWLAAGATGSDAIQRAVTVLVIACPHALGLAVPLVVAISTTIGAQGGLLVRDRRGLEEARHIDTVVFDKTGTLTRGEFGVVAVTTAPGIDEERALALAASVEQDSEHPIAEGIVRGARERGVEIPRASEFTAIPGVGVRATAEGLRLAVGGPALLRSLQVELPPPLSAAVTAASQAGRAAVALVDERDDGPRPLAVFTVADVVRPESREAVEALHRRGVKTVMLTGDARSVAEAVAREIGIDEVLAEVRPDEKAGRIAALQGAGRKVAMVGDGVNDAPALATADVGVAIGAGTDVAVEAGDVVLVRSDPRDVPRIIALSRATYRKMVQNLWWAAGYNIVAIPLAAGVLASYGILLSPAVGAVLMSLSTIVVAINAQLLRRVEL
jgi:Cu2+-exporting ATPase